MRKLIWAAIAVLFVIPASAQVHQATPLDVLLARLGVTTDHHHHDTAGMASMPSMQWDGSAVTTDAVSAPQAAVMAARPDATAKTFAIEARQFAFSVTPSPFVVNVGDDVTLNISVPSNDGSSVGHGFFLENYMNDQLSLARGRSVSVHFIATVAGTFTYLCTVTCGDGHPGMNGLMTVNAQAAAPVVSSITPSSGSTAGGSTVTISGSNFQTGASVLFGGAAAGNVTVVNSLTITAQVPPHAAGRVSVVVTNPDNQSVAFDGYTYIALPSITSISPTSGPSTGGTQITITGTNFVAGATVKVGGIAATNATVVSATTITATTPAIAPTEQIVVPKDVVVTNPDGQSATLTGAFTYALPALTVTSVDPSGATPAGGVTVTIIGSGFTTAVVTNVTFGGVPAASVTVLSTNAMHATVPAHNAGTVDVTVMVGSNTVTLASAFTYGTPPPRRRSARH